MKIKQRQIFPGQKLLLRVDMHPHRGNWQTKGQTEAQFSRILDKELLEYNVLMHISK